MQDGDPHRVLARNAACHQCRRRKLKCDAVRPTCGNCRKPRQRGPIKYEPPEPCTWDEIRDPSARTLRKRENKRRKMHELEGPQDGFQQPWQDQQQQQQQPQQQQKLAQPGPSQPHGSQPPHMPTVSQSYEDQDHDQANLYQEPYNQTPVITEPVNGLGMTGTGQPYQQHGPSVVFQSTYPSNQSSNSAHPNGSSSEASGSRMASRVPDLNLNFSGGLIWPDWPQNLPSPVVVDHVVNVFFDRVPTVPKMFNRAHLFSSLQLPPRHPNFPSTMVLHGILAITAPFLSPETVASREYFPVGTNASETVHPEHDLNMESSMRSIPFISVMGGQHVDQSSALTRFQMWHRRRCLQGVGDAVNSGDILAGVQSLTLAVQMDFANGWFTDVFMESACAVRMALPQYLHLSSMKERDSLLHNPVLVAPAQSTLEQAEQDRTWWLTYYVERMSTCGTAWPTAVADNEISVEMPVIQHIYDTSNHDGLIGVQSFKSPDFYSEHPPQHMDSLNLLIKAMRLYGETSTFIRRYTQDTHTYARYLSDPELRRLMMDINTFRMSFPPQLRRPMQPTRDGGEAVDADLFTAISLTHACVLNLGQALITHLTWNDEAAKMILSAVRAILSLLFDLQATSYDLTLLPPVNSFIWGQATRCLLRFINSARLSNNHVASNVFEAEVQEFHRAHVMFAQRHPIAVRHLKLVETFKEQATKLADDQVRFVPTHELIFDAEYGIKAARRKSISSLTSPVVAEALATPTPSQTGSLHSAGSQTSPAATSSQQVPQSNQKLGSAAAGGHRSASHPVTGNPRVKMSPNPRLNPNGTPNGLSSTVSPMPSPLQGSGAGMHQVPPVQQPPSQHPPQQFVPPQPQPLQQPQQQQPHQPQQQQQQPPPPQMPGQQQQQHPQQGPQGQRPPPQPMTAQQQQFIQQQQANLFSGFNAAGEVPLPGWFQTYDGFDVNSYSFDVEQMANLFQTQDPNGTFDGSHLVYNLS